MICPKCKSYQVRCVETRAYEEQVRRRRACSDCGHRFNTIEIHLLEYKSLKQIVADLMALCKEFEERAAWLRIKHDK